MGKNGYSFTEKLDRAYEGIIGPYAKYRGPRPFSVQVNGFRKNRFPDLEAAKRYVQEALFTGAMPSEIKVYRGHEETGLTVGWFKGDINLAHYL